LISREVVAEALRELLGRYPGRLAGALDLAHGREEEPTTETFGRIRRWPVAELQQGVVLAEYP
jgi:hypothetical protein